MPRDRMTPPQSPGEGTQGSLEDCTESSDQGNMVNIFIIFCFQISRTWQLFIISFLGDDFDY